MTHGRTLSEVEIRTPNGNRQEFESIAFIDHLEWKRVARALRDPAAEVEELPAGVPRYVVSTTFRNASSRERNTSRVRSH